MTRFELARLVGILMLERERSGRGSGTPVPQHEKDGTTRKGTEYQIRTIAKEVLCHANVDAVIRRPLPDGGHEDVHVSALKRDHLLTLFEDRNAV